MPKIEIDQDLYDHLLKNIQEIGESASSILRRLLKLNAGMDPSKPRPVIPMPAPAPGIPDRAQPQPVVPPISLGADRTPERLARHQKAVDRFLILLGWLQDEHRENFSRVLKMGGTQRRYFAKSARELNEAGNSVQPAQIPGSGYWVITNNDTPKKARMIDNVLQAFGMPLHHRMRWVQAVKGEALNRNLKPPGRQGEDGDGDGLI